MMDGKTILLTGAAGGIGRATARSFADAGANLVLADLDAAPIQEMMSELGVSPARFAACCVDVVDVESCQRLVEVARARFGTIDTVIPNAGIYRTEPFESMTSDQWRGTMAVNLDGVFNTIGAALSIIAEGGSIVNISSRAGHCGGSVGHAHYGAAKGAILALTRGLARELGPRIRVNCVSPGIIETPMTADSFADTTNELLRATPLQRFGSAAEVAEVILFLASNKASFVTGETIHVNGGIYMD